MRRPVYPLLVVVFVAALSALPAIAAPNAPTGASPARAQDSSELTLVLYPEGNGVQPQQAEEIDCDTKVDYPMPPRVLDIRGSTTIS